MRHRLSTHAILACTVLALGACATQDTSAPAETFATGPSSIDLDYALALSNTAPRSVRASLAFAGTEDGTTTLRVDPSWASVQHPGKEITDLAVADSAGHALETTHPDDDSWIVKHEPGAHLVATWTLRQPPSREPLGGNDYRTVANNDLFQMIGNLGLVYPPHLGDGPDLGSDPPRGIRFEWRGFAEEGLSTACSFGVGPGPFVVEEPVAAFRQAIFMAGRIRVVDRDVPGGKLAVAIAGDDWGFVDGEFADLVARIVSVEREFFGDFTDRFFLVTLAPQGPRRTDRSFSLGGTGLTDSFALFVNPGMSIAEGTVDRNQVLHLLAHEYFHTWNGRKIPLGQPEELGYWFSEGFTEFYARRLLFRAGLLTLDEYVNDLNDNLRRLAESPARNSPNERVRAEFWKDHDVGDLPYLRGGVVALALDHELRVHSNGERGLDEFMKTLFASSMMAHEQVTCESMLARIEEETDADFAALVRNAIVDGADLPLRDDVAAPTLRLVPKEVRPLAPGFDVTATLQKKEVCGVIEGSIAWNSGLRDGQPLRALDFDRRDANRPLRITVVDGGADRSIEFDPRGPPTTMPAFEIGERDETRARTIL